MRPRSTKRFTEFRIYDPETVTFKREVRNAGIDKLVKSSPPPPPPSPLPLPHIQETIPEIPVLEGSYLEFFQSVKRCALACRRRRSIPGLCQDSSNKLWGRAPTNGFRAFCMYHVVELYDVPSAICFFFLAMAWQRCPHKCSWEFYSFLYMKYQRSVPFHEWLVSTPKRGATLFIIDESKSQITPR